jgi:hypothetical protein
MSNNNSKYTFSKAIVEITILVFVFLILYFSCWS